MKNKIKRLWLLAIIMCTTLGASAYDAEINGIYYNFNTSKGTATVTYYSSSSSSNKEAYSGNVTIPNSVTCKGTTYSVTSIGFGAFRGCSDLTSITIPESVTEFQEYAFSDCSGLTSIIIPDNVTTIGDGAFWNCSGLTSIYIGKGVSWITPFNNEYGDSPVFYGCTNLTTVTINSNVLANNASFSGKFGTQVTQYKFGENVTSIPSGAFKSSVYANLTSISIGSNVTSIGADAFAGCTGLKKAEFASIGSLCGMQFENAYANPLALARRLYIAGDEIKDLIIPGTISNIKEFAFYNCYSLKSVSIGARVTNINNDAFAGCTGLERAEFTSIESLCRINFSNAGSNPIRYAQHLYIAGVEANNVIIPEGITSIKDYTFYNNKGLTSIIIPSSLTSIGNSAFSGCTGLNTVSINSNSIASKSYSTSSTLANIFGTHVTEYRFGGSVKSIGQYACYNCNALTSVSIGSSVTNIENYAFQKCNNLTRAEFSSIGSLCSIKFGNNYANPLALAKHLYIDGEEVEKLEIPNGVATLDNRLSGCVSFNSVSIPESMTSISSNAFYDCTNLSKAEFANIESLCGIQFSNAQANPLTIAKHLYISNEEVTKLIIPENVSSIGRYAFYNGESLSSVSISSSVTSIGSDAFSGCSGLTMAEFASIEHLCGIQFGNAQANPLSLIKHLYFGNEEVTNLTIPENVISIGNYAFYNCEGLTSVYIPNSVTSIGNSAFYGCVNVAKLTLDCNNIGTWFNSLAGIKELTLGNNVQSINSSAFSGCNNLETATIGNNITSVGNSAFPTSTSLFVNRGTPSLLALWNAEYLSPYQMGTENILPASSLIVEGTTQMTATIKVENFYDDMENTLNDNVIEGAENVFLARPEYSQSVTLRVLKGGVTYTPNSVTFRTLNISPTIIRAEGTASSMVAKASYLEGDAQVTSQILTLNGVSVEGDMLYLTGLKPNTSYKATYTIKVDDQYEYTKTINLKTDALTFQNELPKVITEGNIIVASQSNLDDAEENVGFQWRRNDWTNDFESKSGVAYLYEGMIEGYIRSLNSNYLWKFRPYYQSADGTYYYGSWSGMDPSDFSYFEPTVHTYNQTTVHGNSVEVKGYAQRGTDNVASQGFMYWKVGTNVKDESMHAASIPSNAQKVEASGTVMVASLTSLDYDTDYNYVAYITTSENETFYGDMRAFRTGEDPTGIKNINVNDNLNHSEGIYDLSGRKLSKMQKGINIIQFNDGTKKKVLVK